MCTCSKARAIPCTTDERAYSTTCPWCVRIVFTVFLQSNGARSRLENIVKSEVLTPFAALFLSVLCSLVRL